MMNTLRAIIGGRMGLIYLAGNAAVFVQHSRLLSNAGMLDGELASNEVTVSNEGIVFGKMVMPALKTKANQNVIISMSTVLTVTNKTQFQKTCKALLQNVDQRWALYGEGVKLSVDSGFMTTDFTVNVNKELVLKGAKLYNFIASDMTVHGATESVIQSRSNLNFISQSLFTFNL